MNRRDFLEKFVELSSVSLILAGCIKQPQKGAITNSKNKNSSEIKNVTFEIEDNGAMAVYGPPPVQPQPTVKQKR